MDRLSELPESLLCHILSFLPTKFSAATSVLSKRWRYLWTDVPVLDLHSSYHESINSSERQFSDIIDTVLMRHNHSDLHTFRLTMKLPWDPLYDFTDYQMETWISNVAARRLQNLHIGLDEMECCIPPCLFTCKTLVQLSLHKCRIAKSTVRLPALKKLHLVGVDFHCEESFSDLISSCPTLEELVIDGMADYSDLLQYRVSSPTIKSIEIVECLYISVDIDTPALEYLKLHDCLPRYKSGRTLVEADIGLTVAEDKEGALCFRSSRVLEFVDKLYNVESLCLQLHYIESLCLRLSDADAAFAASTVWFYNLTILELAADRRFLLKFLEYAPNLQALIIRNQKIGKYPKYWEEPQQVHPCLTSHLTSITFHNFDCSAQDPEVVRYFLRNAKILKNMDIYFMADSFNSNQKRNAQKSISLFERGSVACNLRFG